MKHIYRIILLNGIVIAALAGVLWSCRGYLPHADTSARLNAMKETGNAFIAKGKPGSAMKCYNEIIEKYYPGMNDREKAVVAKAYNNRGYVCFYCYNDFVQAYGNYRRALEISSDIGYGSAATLLNIGNLCDEYGTSDKGMHYWRQSFAAAVQDNDMAIALVAFGNLLCGSVEQSDRQHEQPDARYTAVIDSMARVYVQLDIPDSTPLVKYTACLYKGYRHYTARQYEAAARCFLTASRRPDTPNTPERYAQEAEMLAISMFGRQGRYRDALALVNEGLKRESDLPLDLRSNYYVAKADLFDKLGMCDSADHARLKAYQLLDTLLNPKSLERIHDIRMMYELKKKDEAISKERTWHTVRELILAIVVVAAVIIIFLLYKYYRKSLRQRQLIENLYHKAKAEAECGSPQKNVTAADSSQAKEIYDKVVEVMCTSREIYSPDFTADRLAELSGYRPRLVSQAISIVTGKNFNVLLGEYRVHEACRRMTSPEARQLTYAAIAEGVGFRSRTNFVAVFKRVTGLTPTEYVKMSKSLG